MLIVKSCIELRKKDKAFKAVKSDKSDQKFSTFKELRNKTQTLIYTAKKDVFQSKLETENKYSKCVWRCLKDFGMPSKLESA